MNIKQTPHSRIIHISQEMTDTLMGQLARVVHDKFTDVLRSGDPVIASCCTCLNFNEQQEVCNLARRRPPARTIAYGCEMYIDDCDIPF